jgi:hypothetical protein
MTKKWNADDADIEIARMNTDKKSAIISVACIRFISVQNYQCSNKY